MTLPDHFEGEDVIITLQEESSTVIYNMEGKMLSWNIGGGSQPTEDIYAFGNKTFNFQKPREKFTLSFEVILDSLNFDMVQFGSSSTGAAIGSMKGKVVKSSDATSRWRIMFWFQKASSHLKTGNVVVPSKAESCYRIICCDVKSVTFDKEFSAEDYFKGTLNLEFSSTDSNGYANLFMEEGIGTGTTTGGTNGSLASLTVATTAARGKDLIVDAKGYMDWSVTTTRSWNGGNSTTKYRYTE